MTRAPLSRLSVVALAAAALLLAFGAGLAQAACERVQAQITVPSATPPPPLRISGLRAIAIARDSPAGRANPGTRTQLRRLCGDWEVLELKSGDVVLDATVDGRTGALKETWGGYQANYPLARGDARLFVGTGMPILMLALALISLLPFIDPRRPLRSRHLDLLALLATAVSVIPFRYGQLWLSTPIEFAALLWLGVRMLRVVRGRLTHEGEQLFPVVGAPVVFAAGLALMGGRAAYNLLVGAASDVGYYSVAGAQALLDGYSVYERGNSIKPIAYGPAMHFAYLPFTLLFPLPDGILRGNDAAAHAAAITFDVLTAAGLFLLGRRVYRGRRGFALGAALLFAWAANPLSFYGMAWSTNDGFIAFGMVVALLVLSSAPARGAVTALIACAKWVPVVLVPLLAAGPVRLERRTALVFALAATATAALVTAPFLPSGGVTEIYRVSVGDLANKQTPFSVWGLYHVPGLIRHLCLAALCLAALATAWRPSERPLPVFAALATAILVGAEMVLPHWIYPYGAWFVPTALVAIFAPREPQELPAPALTASGSARSPAGRRALQ